MSMILSLFITFFKIGLFSFGGGYAMISLLQQEVVSLNWLTVSEFGDVVAISQITPGPVATNMATFVGFRCAGLLGSFVATLGVSMPSLIIVIIISKYLAKFHEKKIVKDTLWGLRPVVVALIGVSTFNMAVSEFVLPGLELSAIIENIELFSIIIFAAAFVAIVKFKVSPVFVILGAGLLGLFLF